MNKIAIDVVILPPPDIADLAIELNRKLVDTTLGKIMLGKNECYPHISLAMGFMDINKLQAVKSTLSKISKRFDPLFLVSKKFYNRRGASVLAIEKTPEIQKLHETTMEQLTPYVKYKGSGNAFNKIWKDDLSYIYNFKDLFSFERYDPHITLGFGKLKNVKFSLKFAGDEFALCHLGPHYTCTKILWSTKLNLDHARFRSVPNR